MTNNFNPGQNCVRPRPRRTPKHGWGFRARSTRLGNGSRVKSSSPPGQFSSQTTSRYWGRRESGFAPVDDTVWSASWLGFVPASVTEKPSLPKTSVLPPPPPSSLPPPAPSRAPSPPRRLAPGGGRICPGCGDVHGGRCRLAPPKAARPPSPPRNFSPPRRGDNPGGLSDATRRRLAAEAGLVPGGGRARPAPVFVRAAAPARASVPSAPLFSPPSPGPSARPPSPWSSFLPGTVKCADCGFTHSGTCDPQVSEWRRLGAKVLAGSSAPAATTPPAPARSRSPDLLEDLFVSPRRFPAVCNCCLGTGSLKEGKCADVEWVHVVNVVCRCSLCGTCSYMGSARVAGGPKRMGWSAATRGEA